MFTMLDYEHELPQIEFHLFVTLFIYICSQKCCQMAKLYPFLFLDCASVGGVGVQYKERKGSNFVAHRSRAIDMVLQA